MRVRGYLFAKLGPIARVSFSTQRAGAKIKWKQSKRLQPGSIVALSSDSFQTDCRVAHIAQRPIEDGLDQNPPVVDIIWADPSQALIDPEIELVMVESRSGYYEAARHALRGLQHAAQEWSPVDKYVVNLNRDDLDYATTLKKMDYSSLVDHLTRDQLRPDDKKAEQQAFRDTEDRFREVDRKSTSILEELKPYTSLDDSQLSALKRITTKEIAIVQGPPGTGKTFTSVKSITSMLKNRQSGDPPIIVSAQTNHALDQLLIYCISAGANILRVGGRTDNDEISQRTMYELRASAKLGGPGQYLESKRNRIVTSFQALVNGVFGGDGLLDPQTLLDAGVITDAQYKSFSDDMWEGNEDVPAMQDWLGDWKIDRTHQEMGELEFEEYEEPDELELELDLNFNDDQIDDDEDRIRGKWVPLSSQFTGRKPHVPNWEKKCAMYLQNNDDVFDIPPQYRGGVYQIMEQKLREATAVKFRGLLDEAVKNAQDTKAAGWVRDLAIIDRHSIDIIGCTTTGLTKYRGYLAALQPRILLIEEAAETREANVVSALFPSIQQLILVGDHQQLPPSCDIARLGTEPFNLNVSLFERLVDNNMPYTMLNRQRRMAPELRYIVQKFYPKLQDHPLVTDVAARPPVPGMGDRRSWFFTHQWPEDTDADNSKYNQAEVEMIGAFIRYLLHNNVKASEITVLTYYRGQKRKLLQRLRHKDMPIGHYFNVATVDSYQGEENEIVILSLVRSPAPGRDPHVGFVDSRNRATVAISRARRGFFMFGNKENILRASNDSFLTWAPIWNAFAEQHRVAMSKGLPLMCQNHGTETWVKDSDGFVGNAGGCWKKCDGKLDCGHACVLKCHIISHDKLPCLQPCTKTLACGHKCAGYCSDPCRCAINCPEYVRIRLEMQLEQAQEQTRARFDKSGVLSPPESTGMALRTHTPSPNAWQHLASNPEAHDNEMRLERQRALGEANVTDITLQRAFEHIDETYIPVVDQDCRRVTGAQQTTDVREEFRLRRQMANLDLDGAVPDNSSVSSDVRQVRGQRPTHVQAGRGASGNATRASSRPSGDTSTASRQPRDGHLGQYQARQTQTGFAATAISTAATQNQRLSGPGPTSNSRGGSQNDRRGNRGVPRGKPSSRPVPINTQTANARANNSQTFNTSTATLAKAERNLAWPRGHVSGAGGAFQAVQAQLQDETNNLTVLSPRTPAMPDSASLIGDMGFDDELEQAVQRQQRTNTIQNRMSQAQQPPRRVQRVQSGQAESLIEFGEDEVSGSMAESQEGEESEKKASNLNLLLDL